MSCCWTLTIWFLYCTQFTYLLSYSWPIKDASPEHVWEWIIVVFNIHLFREGLSEKGIRVHMTIPKGGMGIHWNFAYRPRGNLQVCLFARGEFVFPLRRPFCVALLLLWVRKILLNFRGAERTLFLHVWKERKPEIRTYFVVILISTCSISIRLPILPFGIGLCSFVLFSDNVSRSSCITE